MKHFSRPVLLACGCLSVFTLARVASGLDPATTSQKGTLSRAQRADRSPPKASPAEADPIEETTRDGKRKAVEEAVKTITAKAMGGDHVAQHELGQIYGFGAGVAVDKEAGFKWCLKAAEGGLAEAQVSTAECYSHGIGVQQNYAEALRWNSKAAETGNSRAMLNMGTAFLFGEGVAKDVNLGLSWLEKAGNAGNVNAQTGLGGIYGAGVYGAAVDMEASVKWFAMGAAQDDAHCLYLLGNYFARGEGVPVDQAQSVRLWRRSAEQGYAGGEYKLGACYGGGSVLARDLQQAYIWLKLAANQHFGDAAKLVDGLVPILTKKQIAAANERVKAFTPRAPKPAVAPAAPKSGHGIATGTGFFITTDGYLVTNHHVVEGAKVIHITIGSDKEIAAKVVVQDKKSDLAILKVTGDHPCLAIAPVRGVKLGATVATVGFPNIGVQGFSPKLAKGEIASLAGFQDDPGEFQISVPLQPGNSGGSLVDAHGNVVGVVCAIMNQNVALATTGTLANSVAYAVKSSLLINLVESVPGLADKLAAPATQLRPFEDVVADTEHATVLIMVSK